MYQEDAVLRLKDRIRHAIESNRDRLAIMEEAELAYNVTPVGEGSVRLRDPETFSNVEKALPRIVSKNPHVVVKAMDERYVDNESNVEKLLENWMVKAGMQSKNQQLERAALIQGTQLAKIFWKREETEKMRYVFNPDSGTPIVNPESDPESPEFLTEKYKVVSYNGPCVSSVPIDAIYIDPEANDIDDAQWIIQKYRTTLKELKENDRYSKLDEIEPGIVDDDYETGYENTKNQAVMKNTKKMDDSVDRVVVFEMYEKNEDGIRLISVCQDSTIEDRQMPYRFNHFPFAAFYDIRRHNSFWGIGEYEPIRSYQNLLDSLGMIDLENRMKLTTPKYVTRGNVDDEEVLSDSPVVHLQSSLDSIEQMQVADTTATTQAAMQSVRNVIQNALGTYDIDPNSVSTATATEINTVNEQRNVRFRHKIENFELAQKSILRMVLDLYQQYAVEPIYMEDGERLLPSQIAGDFMIDIETGSSRPVNVQLEREDAMSVYELVRDLFPQDVAFQASIVEWMLEKWDKPERIINSINKALSDAQYQQNGVNAAGTETVPQPGEQFDMGSPFIPQGEY